jgi:transposase
MDWPPYSPDLNPIENLWAIMKQEIYKLHPELEHANDSENTRQLLTQAAKEAWHAIENRVLYKLSVNMPKRVEAVIAAQGWYTKY